MPHPARHPPTPQPIASLFPPDRLPTGRRRYYAWRRRAPYPPLPRSHPPRAREIAALFHHFALIHLVERSRSALGNGDHLAARFQAEDAASFYARFIHRARREVYDTRRYVENQLGQILIAPFRQRIGHPSGFARRHRRPTPPPRLSELFEDTLRARLEGKQPFVYRRPPTPTSPFERTLSARVHGNQPFLYRRPDKHGLDCQILLARILNPRPLPDPLSTLRDRYIQDFYSHSPF